MKNKIRLILSILILSQGLFAQEGGKLPVENEPGLSHPYGKLNPAAPTQTAEFSFMIGEFDCLDEIIDPRNGK